MYCSQSQIFLKDLFHFARAVSWFAFVVAIFKGLVGDTNHQCSRQRLSPKKETCDHGQKASFVCGNIIG